MKNKNDESIAGQMSILDLLDSTGEIAEQFSSGTLESVIAKLMNAKDQALKREKEAERKRREEERKQKELEEKLRHDAHVKEITSMDLPLDWNNIFDSDRRAEGVHADSAADALILSLTTLGKVDIEYISSITGMEYKEVIRALKGSIYQNPDTWDECFYMGWESSEEYLSGNLRSKLKSAKKADRKYNGYFSDNVAAIEKVLPPAVATKDIYVTLGSPWVPTDVIDDFIKHLLGDPYEKYDYYYDNVNAMKERDKTIHDDITGTWEIPNKSRYRHSIRVSQRYGTRRMEALYIIEKTLNMQTVAVWDETRCAPNVSGKKKVINKHETVAAIAKQQKIIDEFQKWIWTDPDRKYRLEKIFEDNYSCVRRRIFDGSFLAFPTMSKDVELYPYQKDAVARILFSPNTLLAHDVGSGKTYVMIAAGQELRRMGLSQKNMYVVPNNIVTQWRDIFLTMYPDAKLLCVEPRSFKPSKRQGVLKKIKDEEYDGIIIAYSCFEMIPLSAESIEASLRDQLSLIDETLSNKNSSTSRLRRKHDKLAEALREVTIRLEIEELGVCFDELGITRLFVDEAHNFKNVPIDTKIKSVLGISSNGSKKCRDMMDKVHLVQRCNEGKGVVMATGTPITNSITDAYIMQQYLQSGELSMLDLQSFDAWVGMFAEQKTEFEIDVDTSSYRLATRFAKFHNLPELTSLLSSIADFHRADETDGMPFHNGRHDAVISKTPEFADYLEDISRRADSVRMGLVKRTDDNMLKITTDGRKAALDMRLVDPTLLFSYQSKVARCVENVVDIYHKTTAEKCTQLIFCDTSTPKAGFNIYSEIKDHLVNSGIPSDRIAFIHDATTETKRSEMLEMMRRGDIRILLGSTFKLGLGVNVQDRLIALHHIDVPWRPADMTQREGRILRQGNMNKQVYIYRYITEGSFDAYSWQLLETKQSFISALLSGSIEARSGSDIDDTVLDYAEVKALAVGDPLIKERVETANELSRYLALQKRTVESRLAMEKELLEIPGKIEHQLSLVMKCEEDEDHYRTWKEQHPEPMDSAQKKREAEYRKKLREDLKKAVHDNIFETKERTFTTYKGFELILPANMTPEKPYIRVVGAGRYHVELGDTEIGNLVRIDNCLDTLGERRKKLREGKEKFEVRKKEIEQELARNENYTVQIEEYRKRLEELDEKLGVDRK